MTFAIPHRRLRAVLRFGIVLPLVTCMRSAPALEQYLARDSSAAFQSDSLGYTARWVNGGQTLNVAIRFTNPELRAVEFENCNGATRVMLETRVDGHWQGVWSPFLNECLSPAVLVAPGASWSTGLHVSVTLDDSVSNAKKLLTPGAAEYRIVWTSMQYVEERSAARPDSIPLSARISNRFVIAVPARRLH